MRCSATIRCLFALALVFVVTACDDDDDAGQSQSDVDADTTTSADMTTNGDTSTSDTGDVDTDDDTLVPDLDDDVDATPPDADDDLVDATDLVEDAPDDGDTDDTGDADTADLDPSAPSCTIVQPTEGSAQPFDETWTFVGSAVDAEDGVLSGASVVWTSDRQDAPIGTGTSFTAMLEGSGEHVITCTATDADGNTGSDSITVTLASPLAEIFHPGNGETRQVSNGNFPFVGQARDAEDGMLSGTSLVWTTTVNGSTMEIGTGTMFDAVLPEGTNEVTLTATDADGNTGSDSIIVIMTP